MPGSPFPGELFEIGSTRITPPRPDPRATIRRAGRFAGPAYPFGITAQGVFSPKDDVRVVATSIVNILTTPKGTIPYGPQIGSVVPYLLFDPLDEVTLHLIRHHTQQDLEEQEPRIVVASVQTNVNLDNYTVNVLVGFRLVGDPLDKIYNAPVDLPSFEGVQL